MDELKKLYEEIKAAYTEFDEGHQAFVEKQNKSGAARARKAVGAIKKICTAYRKSSVELVKALKKA